VSYVLDTTAVSALMRSEPGPSRRLLREVPSSVAIPQPVIAEIRYGLMRLPRSRRRRGLEARLDLLLEALPRVVWDDEVSRHFGEAKADLERRGVRVDDFDVAIAAHALAEEAIVVTRNVRHFERVRGLAVEDWTATP
jgi:tRNA(fMet)-specific endonuclease VapC